MSKKTTYYVKYWYWMTPSISLGDLICDEERFEEKTNAFEFFERLKRDRRLFINGCNEQITHAIVGYTTNEEYEEFG
jgi:hypothetical protein